MGEREGGRVGEREGDAQEGEGEGNKQQTNTQHFSFGTNVCRGLHNTSKGQVQIRAPCYVQTRKTGFDGALSKVFPKIGEKPASE